MSIRIRRLLPSAIFLVSIILTLPTHTVLAEDIPIVDGALWTKSTAVEKHSYLIGIGNLLDVEYAYQKRSGRQPSDDQSIIRRLYEDIDEMSLEKVAERIDQWYQRNPDKMSKAVLDVIWVDMVLPE